MCGDRYVVLRGGEVEERVLGKVKSASLAVCIVGQLHATCGALYGAEDSNEQKQKGEGNEEDKAEGVRRLALLL